MFGAVTSGRSGMKNLADVTCEYNRHLPDLHLRAGSRSLLVYFVHLLSGKEGKGKLSSS